MVEHHKRFDPAYADAREKAQELGDPSYFYAYMSQPKNQLDTFKVSGLTPPAPGAAFQMRVDTDPHTGSDVTARTGLGR